MPKSTCSLPNCERAMSARSYCRLHYTRFMKHGDPMADLHRVQRIEGGRRICKGCGEAKPPADFHRDSSSPDGYRAQCKPCRNGYMATYHEENRDKRKVYERSRRADMRVWDRARYERDKDKRIALASDGIRNRRARMAGIQSDAGITIEALREIHGDECCYCGVGMDFERGKRGEGIAPNRATLEHTLPVSRGGTHTFDNTTLACHRCNVSKNRKTVAEWEEWKAGGRSAGKEAVTTSADC